jgi:hypothetical protein
MTITRQLAGLFITNNRMNETIMLYDEARQHYMSQPQILNPAGDLNTPFGWYSSRNTADTGTNYNI